MINLVEKSIESTTIITGYILPPNKIFIHTQ